MRYRYGNFHPLKLVLVLAMGLGFSPLSRGDEPDLLSLSLEELLNVQITSVSRKSQRLTDSAAAAFVLSNNVMDAHYPKRHQSAKVVVQ